MIKYIYPKAQLLFLLFIVPCFLHAQVNLTPSQTAMALAQKLTGAGITITNPTLTCSPLANGIFTVVSSNLGLDSGIVLTTGRALTVGSSYGVNGPASVNASTNAGMPGDPQLATLANSSTFDACKLEFDLVPKGDTVRFDYVFGSEEYNTSTCGSYNDAFAFFISGPGIATQDNMALVPGTNIPVTVNTINSGVPGPQGNIINCTSMGAGSPFTAYYVNNATGTTITYRGFTTVLKAVHAVTPCATYHLKITIADAGNSLFDSGVFIKAGSLKTSSFNIKSADNNNASAPTAFIVKGCAPGKFVFKRSQALPSPQTLKYQIGGTAGNGIDYAQITDSVVIPANDTVGQVIINGLPTPPAGAKTVKLSLISPYGCNGIEILDTASLRIEDAMKIDILTPDTTVCEGKQFTLRVAGSSNYTYQWSPATYLNNATIKEPQTSPTANIVYTLTATWPGTGCAAKKDSIHINTSAKPTVDAGVDQSLCSGQPFTLKATITPSIAGVQYAWSGPHGFTATNNIIDVSSSAISDSGIYRVTATSGVCPPVSDSVKVVVIMQPLKPVPQSPVSLCKNEENVTLYPAGKTYFWYTEPTGGNGSNTPDVKTASEGMYTLYVSERNLDCESERAPVEITVEKCCEDNLFIPTAFTPNADGKNDRFVVIKGPNDKIIAFQVFNRWGQVVFESNGSDFWDGTFGNVPAEIGTYFYHLQINCERGKSLDKKGEVILYR